MTSRVARMLLPAALVAAVHGAALPALAQPRPSGAQPSRDLVQRGRDLYEDQRYEESIETLSGALVRPGDSPAQRIEIYRLLAFDYIILGRNDEADAAVRALLSLQPGFELPKSESPRFRDFFAAAQTRWEAEGRPGLVTEQSAPPPVAIKHTSPSEAKPEEEVPLAAQLDDPDHRVAGVALFYRTGSSGKYAETAAQVDGSDGAVRASIPATAVRAPYVAYYLLARDKSGLPLASSGDADAPLRIPVPEKSGGWVLPVAIGGGVLGAAGIVVGSLALAGAFKGSSSAGSRGPGQSTVNIGVMTFR
jgi:tetratricopeptide (TPR) repeat protein